MDEATDHLDEMAELHALMDDTRVRKAIALYRKLYKVIES